MTEFSKSFKSFRIVGNPVLLDFRKASNITKWKGKREVEEKYSNKLSMKALAGWKHFLIDSTFRIGTVLEWVFQLVILLNSCFQSDNM